jgi:hypothetical protein
VSGIRPTRSLEEIAADVRRRVYEAVLALYEEAEHNDQIVGNGHHMAQTTAENAVVLLTQRGRFRKDYTP